MGCGCLACAAVMFLPAAGAVLLSSCATESPMGVWILVGGAMAVLVLSFLAGTRRWFSWRHVAAACVCIIIGAMILLVPRFVAPTGNVARNIAAATAHSFLLSVLLVLVPLLLCATGLALGRMIRRRAGSDIARRFSLAIAFATVVVAFPACLLTWKMIERYTFSHAAIAGPPALSTSADNLKRTVVVSMLDVPIRPGSNLLWCAPLDPSSNQVDCGCLPKNVPFAWAFDRLGPCSFQGEPVTFFGGTPVSGRAARQGFIWYSDSCADFIIELRTCQTNYHLFIARMPAPPTLAEAVELVKSRLRYVTPLPFPPYVSLAVPELNFDIVREYTGLCDKSAATNSAPLPLDSRVRRIRFRLDGKGALVLSEVLMHKPTGPVFMCDGPFLIMLCYRDMEQPYLVIWVDNAELLVAQR